MEHPLNIETEGEEGPIDLGSADSLEAALVCARTFATGHDVPLREITIYCNPGFRLVAGELMYSADWLG